MAAQTYLPASRVSRFSRLLLDSPHHPSPNTDAIAFAAKSLRRLIALVIALLLLPIGQADLLAQQAPYYAPYTPYQQSSYAQPQPYAQQNYARYPQQNAPPTQPYPQPGYGQAQPLNAQQLEQLVAPIALYPDILVAQVLTASTYPVQIVDADHWRQTQGNAYSDQIAAGANVQAWDPSVKSLTAFPQVLAEMDRNLQWTTELGNAYYNQPQETFAAVQVMRQRAQVAGNLQNTPQQAVSYDQGNILLAPVNPQMIYVPAYNPWTVYGQPVSPYPGFSLLDALGSFFGSSPVRFGLGIAMAAFSHMSWGWLGWGLSWLAHAVLFHQSNYTSQSATVADWGFPNGGPRAFSQLGWTTTPASNYYRTSASYAPANGFMRTPYTYPYGGNRPAEPYGRGYQNPGAPYTRPSQEPYNRIQPTPARQQQYGRSTYGSTYGSNLHSRPGATYGNPMQAYSAPAATIQRGYSGQRSSNAFMGNSFAKSPKPPKSSGFHSFGGGHAPKAPKSFSAHSGGGGHFSGGHGGGKHHFL